MHRCVVWFLGPSRMLESQVWMRMQVCDMQVSEKSKKVDAKGSGAFVERDYSIGACVPWWSSEKINFARTWKIGITSRSQVLEAHDASRKNTGKEVSKVKLRSEIHRVPNLTKERKTKSQKQERWRPQRLLGTDTGCSRTGGGVKRYFLLSYQS